ncbi:type VI secretion system baseplate subunit TssG [Niveispirillum sp. KHB5.9]|uniref:type VI secretion system baseplate subunit TssG n=1 Tax=Niveispirillum sp. KHB5.9 TaxID=3400269 RepID=UPI003A8538D1
MADPDRTAAADIDAAIAVMAQAPWRYGLFAALRLIEARAPRRYRLGARGGRPRQEAVRLSQMPLPICVPGQIHALELAPEGRPHRLWVHGPGLLGPHGPMPGHVNADAPNPASPRLNRRHAFIDLFNHRLLSLLYRAWADTEPVVAFDQPGENHFHRQVASLIGLGSPGLRDRDALSDAVKYRHAGFLARSVRAPEGLETMARGLFGVPTQLMEFIPDWLDIPRERQWSLRRTGGEALGRGMPLGARAIGVQHLVELRIGPLDYPAYRRFFPGGPARPLLAALARTWLHDGIAMRVRPLLAPAAVPRWRLSGSRGGGRLGLDCWLGRPPGTGPAADLAFHTDPATAFDRTGTDVPTHPAGGLR